MALDAKHPKHCKRKKNNDEVEHYIFKIDLRFLKAPSRFFFTSERRSTVE